MRSPLPHIEPTIKHDHISQYPTSFPLSNLRHHAHENPSLEGRLTLKSTSRTRKPRQKDLDDPRKATVRHTTRLSRKSLQVPSYVTVTGYITTFNGLVNGLLKKYTRGELARETTQNDQVSLTHQALTYLILSNLGVTGVDEDETLIYLTDGACSSRLHECIIPLLGPTATRQPFDLWITGLNKALPSQIVARVQVLY